MSTIFKPLHSLIFTAISVMILAGCSGNHKNKEQDSNLIAEDIMALDTATPIKADSVMNEIKEELDYDQPAFENGIIPVIEAKVPEYAEKLAQSGHDGFIVVDKARMKVILYDRYGYVVREYGMACARNYGTKHKKGDSRTPEGFFSVQGIYDSTDWLYTDDNGRTSKKKGQFGPRFIRLSIPGIYSIGIHGTCAPWSIGHRASHGCIRLTNENIMELVDLVKPDMPVIVLPGKRDREINRKEGTNIAYFPTDPKYEISAKELACEANRKYDEAEKNATEDTDSIHEPGKASIDSISTENNISVTEPVPVVPDSVF